MLVGKNELLVVVNLALQGVRRTRNVFYHDMKMFEGR